jgi:hypothetical protein
MAQEMIKIDFRIDDGTYSFSDALHLPANHTYADQEIEAMKQARFDRWVSIITAPPPPPEETNTDVTDVTDTSGQ